MALALLALAGCGVDANTALRAAAIAANPQAAAAGFAVDAAQDLLGVEAQDLAARAASDIDRILAGNPDLANAESLRELRNELRATDRRKKGFRKLRLGSDRLMMEPGRPSPAAAGRRWGVAEPQDPVAADDQEAISIGTEAWSGIRPAPRDR